MGETIEFPNKQERLYYLGKQAFEKEDYLKALDYFVESYQMQSDRKINQYIVTSHLMLGNIGEAYGYMKEFEKSYQDDDVLQPLYFDVLLKRKMFLSIHKWLSQLDNRNTHKQQFYQSLETAEQFWTTVDNQEYIKRLTNFQHLAEQSVAEQVMTMKEVNYLTKHDFLGLVTKGLLSEDTLSPLIRAQLVDELVQLKQDETIEMIDVYQKSHQVKIENLPRLSTAILTHPLYSSLSEYIENNEPSQEKLVMGVLKTHLGMSYPFLDAMTEDVNAWKLAYLLYFNLIENIHLLDKDNIQKRYKEIKTLDNIMMNTMTKL